MNGGTVQKTCYMICDSPSSTRSKQIPITKPMLSRPFLDCPLGVPSDGYRTHTAPQRYLSTLFFPQTHTTAYRCAHAHIYVLYNLVLH